MFMTLHVGEKKVKIEIGIVEDCDGVNEFKEHPFEVCIAAQDGSFTFVGYADKQEVNRMVALGDACLQEHDRIEAEKFVRDMELEG